MENEAIAVLHGLSSKQREALKRKLLQKGGDWRSLPVLRRPHDLASLPVSYGQLRLWILYELDPDRSAYNVPLAMRVRGELHAGIFGRALNHVVARHEVLRTRYEMTGEELVQVIDPHGEIRVALSDLTGMSEPEREREVMRLAQEEAQRPFDLATGPVVRATLLKLAPREHVMLLTLHHIACDAWSVNVLRQEVAAHYAALLRDESPSVPELSVQYADFAHWQRQWFSGDALEAQLNYWRAQLDGAPDLLALPTDRPRPAMRTQRGALFKQAIPVETVGRLQALSRRTESTLFMVLTAAFNVLLWRYTGQADICVGTVLANRSRCELEPLIGFFVNTVALRTRLNERDSFLQLLQQVKATTLAAQEHQDVPFEQVVDALKLPRSASHTPLFQTMLMLQNAPQGSVQAEGELEYELFDSGSLAARFDVTLNITQADDRLWQQFEYSDDLFDQATIARMSSHFGRLLEQVAAEPGMELARLQLLDPSERLQLVHGFNATEADVPTGCCVHELFQAHAARTPQAAALVFEDTTLTYAELNARANRLAHRLIALGVRPDSPVVIALPRGVEMVVAVLATLKAGGAYVPLDPDYPSERLAFMLDDCRARVVLTDTAVQARLSASRALLTATVLELDAEERPWDALSTTDPDPRTLALTPDHLAYIIYTSGSTGQPKGAMVSHAGLVNLAHAQIASFGVTPDSRVLQFASFSFDACISETVMALCSGAALHVPAPGVLAGQALLEVLRDRQITHATLPPAVLTALPHGTPLPKLHTLVMAGEAASEALVQRWAPGRRLLNAYGPTEATVCASMHRCDAQRPGTPPIGRPITNTRIYVLDARGQPVPVGVTGELHLAGAGLARGYLRRPDLTAERFIPDPFATEPGARMYETGDLGRWLADGTIEFLGRNDHQVKVRGFRIEPGEIEAALHRLPGLRDAVVIAHEDPAGDKRLVAYVVADEFEPQALRAHLAGCLPPHMVPAAYVRLEALPLTPNGKLDRKALPDPEGDVLAHQPYAAPQTDTERALAAVWSQLLELPVERIGRDDDFFALGGHSLKALMLLERIRKHFDVQLALRTLFETGTVRGLANAVRKLRTLDYTAVTQRLGIERIEEQPDYEVAAAQRRLWLLHQLDPGSTAYHVPALLELPDDIDRGALQRALSQVLARHEALRTVIVAGEDGIPRQRVQPPWSVEVGERRIDDEAALQSHYERFIGETFDLSTGPLFRAEVLHTWDGRQLLAWCMHEIIADGSSAVILEREVQALLQGDGTAMLAPLPIQYKDYAAWQNRLLREDDASRQYWHEQLGGDLARLELPYDRRPTAQAHAGVAQYAVAVTGGTHQALRRLCQSHKVTVAMVLQAAVAAWLARLTGSRDIVLALPFSGRDVSEVEPLIGFFLNTVLLRIPVEPGASFEQLLDESRHVTVHGLQHQHYPFEELIEELDLPRPHKQFPVTPVLFNVLNFLERGTLGEVPAGHRAHPLAAKAELEFTVLEHVDALVIQCGYRTALFKPATVEYLMQQLLSLLEQVGRAPGEHIEALPLFSDMQARTLQSPYLQFANELPPAPPIEGVLARIARQVRAAPDAFAIEWQDRSCTYAELQAHSDRIARQLQHLGCTGGEIVALLLPDPIEHIAAVLGTLKAGAVFMTLETGDPLARLQSLVARVAPRWWIAEHDSAQVLAQVSAGQPEPLQGLWLGLAAVPGLTPLTVETAPVEPPDADACYLFFTSGSTGQPKPILGRSQSLAQFIDWEIEAFGVGRGCRVSQLTAPTFDAWLRDVFVPLCAGGTVCVPPQRRPEPDRLLAWLDESRVELVHCVPSVLRALLAYAKQADEALPALAALQRVCLSGEPVLPALVQAWRAAFGERIELVNFYGASETTMIRCWHRISGDDAARGFIPIGRPIAHTQAIVLDGQGRPCAPGTPGEIWLRSRFFTHGYHGDAARTAEVFVANPLRAHDELLAYRSGDLGVVLDDGSLRCLGRRDGQVKVNGVRIEVGEIENVLLSHPQVREAAVVAHGDDDGGTRLSAHVVADAETQVLHAHLAQRLPASLLPQRISLHEVLPLTSSGKIDRKALAARDDGAAQEAPSYIEPATETERTLAALYAQVLGREPIGREGDFFALGGHSLQALMLLARIRKHFDTQLPLRTLFETRTVRGLAEAIDALRSQHVLARDASRTADALAVMEPVSRTAALPLAPVQERLWMVHQMQGLQDSYNMPLALQLQGPLSIPALQAAFDALLQRHETLRTRFLADAGGQLRQEIEPTLTLPIPVRQALREEVPALTEAHAQQVFDLGRAPLLNVQVLRLDEQEHVLLLNMHHIISDGWSMNVLGHDMEQLYAAQLRGKPAQLPALGVQYADYAHWLRGQDMAPHAAYWAQQLHGYEPGLTLPLDRPAQPEPSAARTLSLDYPAELSAALGSFCAQHGATLFMALTAALGAVLQRYTGRRDLCLGTTVAGRDRAELEPLIGFFINIVALRLDLSGDPSGSELIERVKRTVLQALEHQALPFEQVLQQHKLSGDSAQELVPVMVRHQNFPDTVDAQWGDGLTVELLPGSEQSAKCPLDLQFFGDARGLSATVEYAADLFDEATVRRLVQHHQQVLQQMVRQPMQPLSGLQLLTADERQIIEQTNRTARELDGALSVVALFEQQAQAAPEACACIDEQGLLSYAELNARANRIAHALRARGVSPEVRVGLYLPRSCEFIAAMLGIFKAGGVYVPLDVNAPPAYLQRLIDDAQPQVMLHGAQSPAAACPDVELLSVAEAASQGSETNLSEPWHPQQLAMLAYTSGSTGLPKGVLVPHGQLLNLLRSMQARLPLGSGDIVAQKTMAPFVVSMKELWGALLAGVPQVVVGDALLKDPPAFIGALQRGRVSRLFIVPSHLQAVLDALDDPEALSHLRVCVTAGEPLSQSLRERVQRTLPWVALWNNFGCTELNDTTYCDAAHLNGAGQFVPIGRPIDNVQVHVLDDRLREQPIGVPGELCVHYAWMARGYWRQPELTAERFVPHPYGPPGSRLYRTGDFVRRLADGSLEYLGREDFDIKIRGQRVDVRQVEAALAACDGVHLAAAGAWRDDRGDTHLVAYVVPRSEQPLQAAWLRRELAERLPAFMVPSLYVALQALPRTTTGKLDRKALPAPQADALAQQPYVAPQTDTERALAAIWSELLDVPLERLGRADDFFALGGHSLLASRVASQVQQALHRPLQLREVFEHPTLHELADRVDALPLQLSAVIAPRAVHQDAPLSFPQQNLWFLDRLEPGNPAFNLSGAIRLSEGINVPTLVQAFRALVDRHEVLRTTFQERHGQVVQHIGPTGLAEVEEVDFSELEFDEREAAARSYCRRMVATRFELSQGPPIRLHVIRLGEEVMAQIVLHHILADSWSMKLLRYELDAIYQAFVQGGDSPLPPLPLQYADYAIWQRETLQGELLQRKLQYWVKQLAGAPELLALPTDRPRPPIQTYRGRTIVRRIEPSRVTSAKELVREKRVTLFSLLLGVFTILLWRYSGQTDIVVGTTVAGRPYPDLEHLIGMFANTLALRTHITFDRTVSDLMLQIQDAALEAYANQEIPFERIVEELKLPRNASHTPLYQVLFSLHNSPDLEKNSSLDGADLRGDVSSFDVRVDLVESGGELLVLWEYNTDLFDDSTAQRMLNHFDQLMRQAVSEPHTPLTRLSLVDDQERMRLLHQFNDTAAACNSNFVHELVEDQVRRTPDATAVVFEGARLTYRELNEHANRLAHHLREIGVRPDSRVAVAMQRGHQLVVSLLATMKAGGAYVPLDIEYPKERLVAMLADCQPAVMLADSRAREVLAGSTSRLPVLDVGVDTAWAAQTTENPDSCAWGLMPDHTVYIIYTSGSTGIPKAAQVRHRGFANLMEWFLRDMGFESTDRALIASSHSFDLTQKNIFGPLMVGATLYLGSIPFEPRALLKQVSEFGITYFNLAPSAFNALVDADDHHQMRSVRRVVLGGEPIQPSKLLKLPEPRPEFINSYGPTECSDVVAYHVLQEPLQQYEKGVPLGKPIRNTRLYVLDALDQLVPAGMAGELCVAGTGVGRGYLHQSVLTAERFVADPFCDGEVMYRTGDLARWNANGQLEFLGRNDFQVKVRGLRVEPAEIEAALLRTDGVREAVVLAREQGGEQHLIAYVAGNHADTPGALDPPLDPQTLRRALSSRLPAHMVPTAFVVLRSLPLMPNGKIDRRALPAPELDALAREPYVAPRTDTERILAGIWSELLGVPLERLGVHDNFFAMGGHSLGAVRVVDLARQRGLQVPLAAMFAQPHLRALAESLAIPAQAQAQPRAVCLREGSSGYRPLFCVPPASGVPSGYAAFASQLDLPISVYGLMGPHKTLAPWRTFAEAAAVLIRQMRDIQGHGPYRLAGWSLAGSLAYEMATQLIEEGESVEYLALFDAFRDMSLLQAYDVGSQVERLDQLDIGAVPNTSPVDMAELVSQWRKHILAAEAALFDFVARPTHVRIHLFTAGGNMHRTGWPYLGWDSVVPADRITAIPVAGSHDDMLSEPFVRSLAREVSLTLHRCMNEEGHENQEMRVQRPR